VFTVEQREALRARVVSLGTDDERVVAGALVGSLAVDRGDRYSDLDLTFAVADDTPIADVLDDWTRVLADELGAVALVDLERDPTTYRVFLLPEALQFDLSMTPASVFRPGGPRFRLLFGATASDEIGPTSVGTLSIPTPALPRDIFGWGTIYALHAHACVERGRLLQADHYVAAVRDHALSLACLNAGVIEVQARGYDDLPADTTERFADTHAAAIEPAALRTALAGSVRELVREARAAGLPHAGVVAERLRALEQAPGQTSS
jgi:hypothetical protein